jgi:hypothetical protein
MTNGASAQAHRFVTRIDQRGDDTVVVYVQAGRFRPGEEVEVGVYLTQGETYAAHVEKKRIPLPDPNNPDQTPDLHIELPATKLDAGQGVTVVTQVTEVWPSVLQQDQGIMKQYAAIMGAQINQGLKAVWTYQEPEGKGPGDSEPPPPGNGGSRITTMPPKPTA